MGKETKHNFHIPLSQEMYQALKAEAKRSQIRATAVARQAIKFWLMRRKKLSLHQEITQYAQKWQRTDTDLDEDLEGAGVDVWMDDEKAS